MMKKITLLFILLTLSIGYSQDLLLGFEAGESGGVSGGPFGGMPAPTVLAGTGSNTTQVLEIVGNTSGEPWQGININLTTNVDLTSTQTMTIDVKSATAITFLVKVNGGLDSAPEAAAEVTHNGDNTWQTLSFTFDTVLDGKAPMANGVYTSFVIHAYWEAGETSFFPGGMAIATPARTFYVDNIKGPSSTDPCTNGMMDGDETGIDCGGSCPNACPAPPSVAPTTPPNRAPANVVSVYGNAYTQAPTDGFQTFGSAVVTELDYSGNTVLSVTTPDDGSGLQYQYFGVSPQYLDLSSMTHMHIDFYFEGSPTAPGTVFIVIAQYSDGTNIQKNFDVTSLASNTWHEMDIEFANFDGNPGYARDQIQQVIVQVAGDDGSITGPFYFDNLYFHNNIVLSNDEFNQASFKVYPNPSEDSWTVSIQNEQIQSINVYDVLGKRVLTTLPSASEARIEGSGLKSGLYFAQIRSVNGLSSIRLIKK